MNERGECRKRGKWRISYPPRWRNRGDWAGVNEEFDMNGNVPELRVPLVSINQGWALTGNCNGPRSILEPSPQKNHGG